MSPFQGSPSIPRGHSNAHDDIEMGIQRSGELGLSNFFEKVEELDIQYEKLFRMLLKVQRLLPGLQI